MKSSNTTMPLLDNEHVKELLSIMETNHVPTVKDLLAVLTQVSAMERQLDAAVTELAALRQELNAAREQTHPIKTKLQNTGATLGKNVTVMRDKLGTVKQNVIDGCKNAMEAFRVKGISALDNISRFFKVRPLLNVIRDELNEGINVSRSAISKIETVSAEYHEAGRHIKNMGRTLMGKETVANAKPLGKLAKSLEAPFKAELSCLFVMRKSVRKAIIRLAALEQAAQRKPSVRKSIKTLEKQITTEQKSVPTSEKSRPVFHEAR